MQPEAHIPSIVFDHVAGLQRAENLDSLSACAATAFASIGLPSFAVARFFGPRGEPAVGVLAGRFNSDWASRYIENKYAASSIIAREMCLTTRPYSWSDVMRRRRVDAAQRRIRDEARECGLSDGLFTPLRWFDGSQVAVVLGGGADCAIDAPEVRSAAEILSWYYGAEVQRLLPGPQAGKPILSPRQLECLAWVRHGKSSSAIGQILGLSRETVEEHISEACRKLDVRTRVQAAVEASRKGLIE